MSTITDFAVRAVVTLAAWTAILLAMPLVGPSGRQVAVVGGVARGLAAVRAAGGAVVDIRTGGVVLARSDRPGFARALYRAGAPLVIEGRIAASCLSRR